MRRAADARRALAFALLLASCGDAAIEDYREEAVTGHPNWNPSSEAGDIAHRDYNLDLARRWTGDCDSEVLVPAEDGGQVGVSLDFYAAGFGVTSALDCFLEKSRGWLSSAPEPGAPAYDEDLGHLTARTHFHFAYVADLRGWELTEELARLCNVWAWRLDPELTEQIARRDLADAAEAGLLTSEELAAAKARDASRPTCSERLIAQGIPREY